MYTQWLYQPHQSWSIPIFHNINPICADSSQNDNDPLDFVQPDNASFPIVHWCSALDASTTTGRVSKSPTHYCVIFISNNRNKAYKKNTYVTGRIIRVSYHTIAQQSTKMEGRPCIWCRYLVLYLVLKLLGWGRLYSYFFCCIVKWQESFSEWFIKKLEW
jgi:hypothetical protein